MKNALSRKQDPREDYRRKCDAVASLSEPVSPLDFVGTLPDPVVLVFERGIGGKRILRLHKEELVDAFPSIAFRRDVYVCYAEYFNGWYGEDTLKAVHAFVVDVDYVPSDLLEWFLRAILPKMRIKPAYIFLSGYGVQFIYTLREPLQVFKRHRKGIEELYLRLQKKFLLLACMGRGRGYRTKLDIHRITQPFRLPGTATKFGVQSEVYRYGEPVPVGHLCEWLDVNPAISRPVRGRKNRFWKKGIYVLPNAYGRRSFYNYAYMKAAEEVVPGHRYLSLFSLSVIAWKCRVPFEELVRDLEDLVSLWRERPDHRGAHPLKPAELAKALKGYNPKATLVSCDALEEWMGIRLRKEKMKRKQQVELWQRKGTEVRNRRKLERMRAVVKLRMQGLSFEEIGQRLGISRSTACRLFKEAL